MRAEGRSGGQRLDGRAYWHDRVVGDDPTAGTDSVGFPGSSVGDWALVEHRDGFVGGVDDALPTAAMDPPPDRTPGFETRTRVPYTDLPFSAWHHLTPGVARREQREGWPAGSERPEPDLRTAGTIACDRRVRVG